MKTRGSKEFFEDGGCQDKIIEDSAFLYRLEGKYLDQDVDPDEVILITNGQKDEDRKGYYVVPEFKMLELFAQLITQEERFSKLLLSYNLIARKHSESVN